ncbi:MAG: hypothetical protein MI922_13090 [Bacteroidales bacterium]|nr:hypothetical protein [Bacteroidales bacterium]
MESESKSEKFNTVEVDRATPVSPPKVEGEIFKDPNVIGHKVINIILFIVAGFLLITTVQWFFTVKMGSNTALVEAMESHCNAEKLDIDVLEKYITHIETERENERDYLLNTYQIVLINLFLPLLTAIVGYIFGVKTNKSQAEE